MRIRRGIEIFVILSAEIVICFWIYLHYKKDVMFSEVHIPIIKACIVGIVFWMIDNIYFLFWDSKIIKKTWKYFIIFLVEATICLGVYQYYSIFGETVVVSYMGNEEDGYGETQTLINNKKNTTICVVVLLVIDIFAFILHKNLQLQLQKKEREILEDYNLRLENLYTELRCFKHDYINILSSLSAYMQERKYEEMQEYFEKNIMVQGQNLVQEDKMIGKLLNLKIPEIKGLVYTKILASLQCHLNIVLDLKEEVKEIEMNSSDLVRVLGVFLDNAIEAARETEKKELYIGFLSVEEGVYIRIENSTKMIIDGTVDQIYELGFSSKGIGRGIGLHGVEKIIENYNNVLHMTEQNPGRFVQQLKIIRRENNAFDSHM